MPTFHLFYFKQAPKDHHAADIEDLTTETPGSSKENEKKLLIGGCIDGTIVIFDWENEEKNGSIVFSLQVRIDFVIR